MAKTRVVNLRLEPYDVYIGRAGHGLDGFFGNPHPVGFCKICNKHHFRGEAIQEFRKDFAKRIKTDKYFLQRVLELKGKKLGCFCKKPGESIACHGDLYVEFLENLDTNLKAEEDKHMVKIIESDIFLAPIQAIVHQANCQCTMGSGIAAALRAKWPKVYDVDCLTKKGDINKLGKFSTALINDPNSPVRYVFNLYSQFLYGRGTRHTDYDAMAWGLEALKDEIHRYYPEIKTLGLPYKMGCCLGGGNWRIVQTIIEETFQDAKFDVLICKI